MRHVVTRLLVMAALFGVAFLCHAEGVLSKVPTREGITTTLFWEAAPDAKATVFLFPGVGRTCGMIRAAVCTGETGVAEWDFYEIIPIFR